MNSSADAARLQGLSANVKRERRLSNPVNMLAGLCVLPLVYNLCSSFLTRDALEGMTRAAINKN
jgi:hypothetical protein